MVDAKFIFYVFLILLVSKINSGGGKKKSLDKILKDCIVKVKYLNKDLKKLKKSLEEDKNNTEVEK
jgi:hypothetical protein